jgi:methylmalonyl-CoA mutase N-terminal domain/subunit
LKAIERGYIHQEIQNAAYETQKGIDSAEQVVVGVNEFQLEEEAAIDIQRIDPELESKQVERLRTLRVKRDKQSHAAALKAIQDAARAGGNLMPKIITAVEAHATVGEIADSMRAVFGEHKEAVVL